MERHTRQHDAIYHTLVTAGRPLLAAEVWQGAAQTLPRLSLGTVYRHLKQGVDDGQLQTVCLPGQNPRYELVAQVAPHHHHFQCRSCERVFDWVEHCPRNWGHGLPPGFAVEDHELVLYGRCPDCNGTATHTP